MAIRSMRPKGQFETALGVAKIIAMVIGASSVAVGVVKLAIPLYRYLAFTAFPAAWSGFRSFLAPQYLFLLVNLIILIIWKLSEKKPTDKDNIQHYHAEPADIGSATATAPAAAAAPPPKPKIIHEDVVLPSPRLQQIIREDIPPSPRKTAPYGHVDTMPSPRNPAYSHAHNNDAMPASPRKPIRGHDTAVAPRNLRRPPSPDTSSDDSCVTADDDSLEYHSPISSPLRHRRLAAIATPSRSAPVSPYYPGSGGNPDADAPESLEDAWKAISGGGTPRVLRKNETFGVPSRVVQMQPAPPARAARREMKKSETFNDAATRRRTGAAAGSRASGLGSRAEHPVLTREPDEMNQKFDAFIKKMNDQLRLQRQESDQRYVDMVRRGY